MFSIKDFAQPTSIEEAYNILVSKRNNRIIGGGAFLRLGAKKIATAVDLSKLELNYIKEQDGTLEIGAMTTLRELETNKQVNSAVSRAVSNIVGVQLRNMVTVGASVFARYGFSDLLPALLVLDTDVVLYNAGRLPLAEFLASPREKDLLTAILIKQNHRQASYQCMRNAASDFSVLNVAVSRLDNQWIVAVGARPRKAAIAHKASEQLSVSANVEDLDAVAKIAADELVFGTNAIASASYRQMMCKTMIKRAVAEVLLCK
jgi:probable selenate reductase FAD-binding subunit